MIAFLHKHERVVYAIVFVVMIFIIPAFIVYLRTEINSLFPKMGNTNKCVASTEMQPNPLCPYVDLVYTWVNGSDPLVKENYKKVTGKDYVENGRTRDFGTFLYSVRAADTFAPWIRQIVIVTNGQVPTWLNTSNPRVRIVTHSEIFPNAGDLPTFNSNAIEANLHRIPGVAPCFFYQNDDFGFARPVCISDYVDLKTGTQQLSFDHWTAPEIGPMSYNTWHRTIGLSNTLLNSYYNPDTQPVRYHYEGHNTRLFRTEILKTMAERWPDDYARTSSHRFRDESDVAIPFLHNNVALIEYGGVSNEELRAANYYGTFTIRRDGMIKEVRNIRKGNYISWCLNDIVGRVDDENKENMVREVIKAYKKEMDDWLPFPSDLEIVPPGTKTIQDVRRDSENANGAELGTNNKIDNKDVDEEYARRYYLAVATYRGVIALWVVVVAFMFYVFLRNNVFRKKKMINLGLN